MAPEESEVGEGQIRLDAERIAALKLELDDEFRRSRLAPGARWLFLALRAVAGALPAVVLLAVASDFVSRAIDSGALPWLEGGVHSFLDRHLYQLKRLVPLWMVATVALAAANLPLVVKAWRQRRLARRLAAFAMVDNLFAERAPYWRWATFLMWLPALFFLLVFLVHLPGSQAAFGWGPRLAILSLLVFLPSLLLVADRFFARVERRFRYFEEIATLKENVGELGEGKTIPRGLASRLGLFERLRLLRATAELAGSHPEPPGPPPFAPASSDAAWVVDDSAPEVRKVLDTLSAEKQVALRQRLDELREQPERGRPLGEIAGQSEPLRWYSPARNEGLVLVYQLDRGRRRIYLWQLHCPQATSRVDLFFSYSHQDEEWFDRLQEAFSELEVFDIFFWTDKSIEPGQIWSDKIEHHLAAARGAFVLLSGNYLASDFIRRNELPQLLERAKKDSSGFLFLWVQLAAVDHLGQDPLGQRILHFQAVDDPKEPLAGLPARGRAARIARWRAAIHRAVYRHLQRADRS